MKPALKEELRQQRRTVFGHRRYWFHIVLWLAAMIACYPYTDEFSRGFQVGMNVVATRANDSTIRVRPDSTIVIIPKNGAPVNISAQADAGFLKRPVLLIDAVVSIAFAALLIYGVLLFVIPYARYRQQKRILVFSILLIFVLVGVAILCATTVLGIMMSTGGKTSTFNMIPFMHLLLSAILVFMLVVSFFSLYYFIDLYDQQKALDRYQDVFSARMLAETNFLKMQINPHFLFNSLNNIYALTLAQSPQAPVIATRLRELVSYMLDDCSQETVAVAGELEFLRNYIALEQLRNPQEQVQISYEVRGDDKGLEIAPLLLVNFIENAFKHGVKAGIDHAEVRIRVDLIGRMLSLDVFNTKPGKMAGPDQSIREAGGIGIRNVRRRLQILYPGRHSLRINDSRGSYSVHLNVTL